MKTKRTDKQKKPHSANPLFPCRDFQKMAEMMKNGCPGEEGGIDCCSRMRKMMESGKGENPKKTQETKKSPKGSRRIRKI